MRIALREFGDDRFAEAQPRRDMFVPRNAEPLQVVEANADAASGPIAGEEVVGGGVFLPDHQHVAGLDGAVISR